MKRTLRPWVKKIVPITAIMTLFFITFIFVEKTYSRYLTDMDLRYTTTTGNIICDVVVDTNATYFDNNIPYFLVKIKNYNENNEITAVNVDYVMTISNVGDSSGVYYYLDTLGNTNHDYESSFTTKTYTFGTDKQEVIFKVYVKDLSSDEKNINFNVNVEAVQKQMEVK